MLAGVALLALAAIPGAGQATSVWFCANNTVCVGAGAGIVGTTIYADVCLVPVAGCVFAPGLPASPVPGPLPATCEGVNNPPVVVAVCVGG